ncbi:MAG: PHP domain-containing protein [Calditerrivibrio sp.]|nr:PHP domain-containing protein [Calditerrivibrio sp.]
MVDLHCHSKYSDGTLSPEELVLLAEKKGLQILALTDHDTIDGIGDFKACPTNIQRVSGLEISINWDRGTFHLIGLFVDEGDNNLVETLKQLKLYRRERNSHILLKLSEMLGRKVTEDEISLDNYGELGRPHIAKYLIKEGIVQSIDEAFEKYLGKGKFLYTPKKRLSLEEANEVIKNAGGLSFVAHPVTLDLEDEERFYSILRKIGVDGIEVYCSLHNGDDIKKYNKIAKEYGFLMGVGSDFHGENKDGVVLGGHNCDPDLAKRLFDMMLKRLK